MTDTSGQNKSSGTGEDVSEEIWNTRYCEVIPVTQEETGTTSWVYNTLGLNDCPPAKWATLTEDEVNAAYGSVAAKLNGPRYWVIDKLDASGSTTTGETFTFGGIEMALRATVTTDPGEETVGEQFYVPNEVKRDTVYTYNAGRTVYELTSPEGDVYIMQSYARIKDKTLNIHNLDKLGSILALPKGWNFTTRTLTEEFKLASGGLAYVVNDDLYNAYQRRT